MKDILIDIQNRLKSEISALKYIDEDWGQLSMVNPPVKFPCALIDISGFQFTQDGNKQQEGLGSIYVTVADIRLTNSSAKAPANQKTAAFKIFDLIDSIHHILHGYTGGDYSSLIRTNVGKVARNDQVKEYKITYTVGYKEASTNAPITNVPTPPITITIVRP